MRRIALAGSAVLGSVLIALLVMSYGSHFGPSPALGAPGDCWSLQVSADPPAEGSVEVSPAPNCEGLYADGTEVTLTANAQPGHHFYYWEDGCSGADNPLHVTLHADTACTADFGTTVASVDVAVSSLYDGTLTAIPGTTTTYTIVVSNSGPDTAINVAVSDPLPAGVTSFTWSGNGQTNVPGALTDTIASLAPGGSVTYTVVAAIDPSATGSLINTVTTTTANDTNPANDSATDTDTLTPQVDVAVTKVDNVGGSSITASTGSAIPGGSVTYTIVVSNSGPSTATNVGVSDPLPAGVTSATWSGDGHSNVSGALSDIIFSLAPGGSVTYTVVATIDPSATGSVTNTVTTTAANDTDPGNNMATDTDTLASADLSVAKSDGVTSVTAGDGVTHTYTITVHNAGPSDATSVSLSDTWPAGFTQGTVLPSQGSCSGPPSFTCALGTIANGGNATVTASFTVPSATTGSQTNSVSVSSAVSDPVGNNNHASDTDTVFASADLSVTKDDGVTTVTAGDGVTYTYTIRVHNAGPSDAGTGGFGGVFLGDTWPAGFTQGTVTPSQGTCSGAGTGFYCALGIILNGGNATVTVDFTVPSATTGSQTNTVGVTSGLDFDPDRNNNGASDTDTVTTCSAPSTTKTHHDADVSLSGVPGDIHTGAGPVTRTVKVVVTNSGDHTDCIRVSLDVIPPGGFANPGGCSPAGRILGTVVLLAHGQKATFNLPLTFRCTNPGAVKDQKYTFVAIADHNGDDVAACAYGVSQSQACFNALANDDSDHNFRVVQNNPAIKVP